MNRKFPYLLFAGLLTNAAIAPAVSAASNEAISRSTAYAIGSLVVIVLGLAIYLAFVIIHPEKF